MEKEEIINWLQNKPTDKTELRDALGCISILNETFQLCFDEALGHKIEIDRTLEIESILDYLHDELNTGHWSDIPIELRYAFSAASYVKSLIIIHKSKFLDINALKECLNCIDKGLLMGAPLQNNSHLLTDCASFISEKLNSLQENNLPIGTLKRKRSMNIDTLNNMGGTKILELICPSLETFNNKHLVPQHPVKIKDCMSHWPAMSKWLDINYLLKLAGSRTVSIEMGSHYVDEDWSQKLMTLGDFIREHFFGETKKIGYLAQYNLFDQIPELRKDICIPEYCCLSESDDEDVVINAWFGPEGTLSPLHQDPKDNFLAQVFGTKQCILFSPSDTPYLYPHESNMLSNTAQIDPLNPDLDKHPEFPKAKMYKCILEPGEMLYIPKQWWHHITALDKSFSVNFWWT